MSDNRLPSRIATKKRRRHAAAFRAVFCFTLVLMLLVMQLLANGGVIASGGGTIASAQQGDGNTPTGTDPPAAPQNGGAGPHSNDLECISPAYCEDETCTCDEGDACTCEDDCKCKTLVTSTCINAGACTNTGCKCGVDDTLCICEDTCQCHFPDFLAATNTRAVENSLLSGQGTRINVTANVSSTNAKFSDVILKTYVHKSLTILPLDIQGRVEYLYTQQDGDYNVIYVKTPITETAGVSYQFEVEYPAGKTLHGTESLVYTVIEGNVVDAEHGTMAFDAKQNDEMLQAKITAVAQETTWNVALTNVALDYKNDADGDDVFRQQIKLTRSPSTADGVYHLKQDGSVVITLPGGESEVTPLRITTEGGANIPFTREGDKITIQAGNLPLSPGFDGDGYSAATSSTFYLVFKLTEEYLQQNPPVELGDGFFYGELETKADFNYKTHASTDTKSATARVGMVTYTPGGGDGSISKYANPFIDGKTFYSDVETEPVLESDPDQMTPIRYTIGFHNRSNTPLGNFYIQDKLPTVLGVNAQGKAVSLENDPDMLLQSVMFKAVTLTSCNAGGGVVTLHFYKDGVPHGQSVVMDLNVPISIADDVDEIRIAVDGVFEHGYNLQAVVEVIGNAQLALAQNAAQRAKIIFVRNKAEYFGISTKDGLTQISGSDASTVHVYPFENEANPPRVWDLYGDVSQQKNSGFSAQTTITRGKEVFYRLRVHPADNEQYVYRPVFLLELPPEVLFDESKIDSHITYSGSAKISLQAEVIANPFGSGKLLIITSDGKQLLNPSEDGYITVQCSVNPDAPQGVSFDTRAYFGVEDPLTSLSMDTTDLNASQAQNVPQGLLDTTDLLMVPIKLTVRGSGYLEGELSVQTEFDRDSGDWHRHPEVADALPGGLMHYQFNVRNGGQIPAENIVLYNVFSTVNDKYIVGNSDRGSKWKPYLIGPVQLPQEIANVATVYYSEYDDHHVTMWGKYTGTDDWTTEPYNYPAIKSIKIVFDEDYQLAQGAAIKIIVPMYAPTDYVFEQSDNHAISSLATKFNFVDDDTIALEPLRVTVNMVENSKGEIKGMVWGDTTPKDGIKDSLGTVEYAEAEREVLLFRYNSETLAYEYLYSTTTDVDGNYKFTNLDSGQYQLRVALPTGYGAGGASADDNNAFGTSVLSDTHPSTNQTYRYIATEQDYQVNTLVEQNRIYTEVDAAIYPEPTDISGTAWRSIDGATVRDTDKDTKDIGLSGVTVRLYRIISGSERALAAQTTTDGAGKYIFQDVPAGRYVVVFTKLTNYSFVERAEEPSPRGSASMAGYSQAKVEAANGEVAGQSYEIWLEPGTPKAGIDCGMQPDTGKITGNIWNDKNGNMAKDTGEGVLANIPVLLYKTAGYLDGQINYPVQGKTDSSGNYEFAGLTPGTYQVVFQNSDGYYVSVHENNQVLEGSRLTSHTFDAIVIEPRTGDSGKTVANKNLGILKKVVISGSVFNDKNANGTFDSGDVKLNTVDGTGFISIARTGGGDGSTSISHSNLQTTNGDYRLETWPGTYTVAFSAATGGYADAALATGDGKTDYAAYLTVKANTTGSTNPKFVRDTRTYTITNLTANVNNIHLALTRPRSIEGVVWHDVDGDGLRNIAGVDEYIAAGRGISIVPVTTNTPVGTPLTASDGLDGSYRFEGLYPGTYEITVNTSTPDYLLTNYGTFSGGESLTTGGKYTVVIPGQDNGESNDPKDKDFGLALPDTIKGFVWQDKEMLSANNYVLNGVYDNGTDAGYAQNNIAALYRYNSATSQYEPWDGSKFVAAANALKANTAANGEYSFTNLTPGNYQVVLTPTANSYFVSGTTAKPQVTMPTSNAVATYSATGDTAAKWTN
ncbi:hypothetical protein LJC55_02695, partial [Eubacteriales bacterium OttesenSCG-928-N14]|nr:hypothetical protein [Eubacteriales bacterium OttesenSCG-928-N14]